MRVCDECGAFDSTRYTVTTDGETYVVDLCDEHANPIIEAATRGERRKKRGPRKRTVKTEFRQPTNG